MGSRAHGGSSPGGSSPRWFADYSISAGRRESTTRGAEIGVAKERADLAAFLPASFLAGRRRLWPRRNPTHRHLGNHAGEEVGLRQDFDGGEVAIGLNRNAFEEGA